MVKKYIKTFRPLKGKRIERKIAAFDIEGGGGLNGFVCGAVATDEGVEFYLDRQAMWENVISLASNSYWVFAHNLEYDWLLLDGPNAPIGEPLYTKSGLYKVSYTRGDRKYHLWDSGNLFPRLSVAALGEAVGKPKIEIPRFWYDLLQRGRPWGHWPREDQKKLEAYVKRDADIVFLAVSTLQETVNQLGGNLRPSIAGTSMDIFRRVYQARSWKCVGPETNKLIRPAFYGGRCENYVFGKVKGVNKYDVNSLYPSVMEDTEYPDPWKLKPIYGPTRNLSWLDLEGVCSCRVEVPDSFLPVLPYRESGRLFFPWGEFGGVWTTSEIRYALSMGAEISSFDWALLSTASFSPFQSFVKDIWGKRAEALAESSPRANWIKLILNSLYGRFGLNPTGGLRKIVEVGPDWDPEEYQGEFPIHWHDRMFITKQIESKGVPAYVNVFLAAQTTAAARIRLHKEMVKHEMDLVYCDTDSIISKQEVVCGAELGDWRPEITGGSCDIVSPKEYLIHNSVHDSFFHAKGIPAHLQEEWFKTEHVRFDRAVTFLTALAEGKEPTEWVETIRSRGFVVPKRMPLDVLEVGGEGWSYSWPWHVEDLEKIGPGTSLLERYPPWVLEQARLKESQLRQSGMF